MWNNSKSLILSSWLVKLAIVMCMVIVVSLIPLGIYMIQDGNMFYWYLLVFVVVLAIPVFRCLFELNVLLKNIKEKKIFIDDNVWQLRQISWNCFFAAVFILLATFYHPIFLLCSGIVGFFGLLMRVVKNMLSEAIELKNENDYTI